MTEPDAIRSPALKVAAWRIVAPGAAGERHLRDAAERALRHPEGRIALVLHLSRLRPPAPRPHHVRIARAILQDTAQLHDGQVFSLGNGDLALLCRDDDDDDDDRAGGDAAAASSPGRLPSVLGRLLRPDVADAATLMSRWRLAGEGHAVLAYAAERLAESLVRPAPAATPAPDAAHLVEAMEVVLQQAGIADITQAQTAALVGPGAAGLRPLYRELGFSIPALEARAGATAAADPYLFRHLAARLDRRMLAALTGALGGGGPLDAARARTPRLHLNLALPTLLGGEFAGFARRCQALGQRLGAEVSLVEATADAAGFAQARAAAAALGVTLVLDCVPYLALLLGRPWRLRADLMKLDWSPRLSELAGGERVELAAGLRAAGPARIVLQRAEDEAAIAWGRAEGIRRFQGRYVDAMLAAGRMLICPQAAACTLRQCQERGAATGPAGRRFCRNQPLLDAAA